MVLYTARQSPTLRDTLVGVLGVAYTTTCLLSDYRGESICWPIRITLKNRCGDFWCIIRTSWHVMCVTASIHEQGTTVRINRFVFGLHGLKRANTEHAHLPPKTSCHKNGPQKCCWQGMAFSDWSELWRRGHNSSNDQEEDQDDRKEVSRSNSGGGEQAQDT